MNQLKAYCERPPKAKEIKKGRNIDLLKNRDRKLAARFYYWAGIKNLRYSETIDKLVEEFDITEKVVIERLRLNQEYIDRLFADKPSSNNLKRIHPQYHW